MRQLVGTPVQLLVRNGLGSAANGGGIGSQLRLPRKQLMRAFLRHGQRRAAQLKCVGRLLRDGEVHQRAIHIQTRRGQKTLVLTNPIGDGGLIKQICVVVAVQTKSVGSFHQIEKQIKRNKTFLILLHGGAQTIKGEIRASTFEIELNFDQRQAARSARDGQLAQQSAVGVGPVVLRR